MIFRKKQTPHFIENEARYRAHLSPEITFVTRLVSVLGMLLFMSYYVADLWAFSAHHQHLIVVRLLVMLMLGSVFFSTFSPLFIKYSEFILPIPYIITASALNYIIYLAGPQDYASHIYFVGLMLIMMLMFGWSFMRLPMAMAICIFILASYCYIELSLVTERRLTFAELLINLSFLISSAVIGFISQLMRDRHLRENYLLQQRFKAKYQQKSMEALDNRYLANHDSLTGLPNRRYIIELLNESIAIADQEDKIIAIMFVDLNGFKQINDEYGHQIGDEVLMAVSKRLKQCIQKNDFLSRLGGDEYLLGVSMNRGSAHKVHKVSNKYIDTISEPMEIRGLELSVSASIGVAIYPNHGKNIEKLISLADQRMYQIKKRNKQDAYIINKALEEQMADPNSSVVAFPSNNRQK